MGQGREDDILVMFQIPEGLLILQRSHPNVYCVT